MLFSLLWVFHEIWIVDVIVLGLLQSLFSLFWVFRHFGFWWGLVVGRKICGRGSFSLSVLCAFRGVGTLICLLLARQSEAHHLLRLAGVLVRVGLQEL